MLEETPEQIAGRLTEALLKRADECQRYAEASFYPRACSEYRAKEAAFREAAAMVSTLTPQVPA